MINKQPQPREANEIKKPKLCCSARAVITLTCFVALFNQTVIRVGVSFAVLCMVKVPPFANAPSNNSNCPAINEEIIEGQLFEFDWPSKLRGYIISGSFYGYLIGPFAAGLLSFRFGGKKVLITGTLVAGLIQSLIPEAARKNPLFFFGLRIVIGFFGGFIVPSFYDIMSHWAVPQERQLLVAGASVAMPFACIVNSPIFSFLCTTFGWVWTFYFTAIWMVLCSIAFFFLMYDYPRQFPKIRAEELAFVEKDTMQSRRSLKIPWKRLLLSSPFHAYVITHFCVSFGAMTILLAMPIFLRDVYQMNLRSNGYYSGLPFLGGALGRIFLTFFFEKIRKFLGMSKTHTRKLFVVFGLTVASGSLLGVTFLTCKYRYVAIACFLINQIGLEFSLTGGYLLSLMEMCPAYTNVASGIANGIANIANILSPIVTGALTPTGHQDEWNVVYYIVIADFLIAIIIYVTFGTSELQSWETRDVRHNENGCTTSR